MLHKFRCKICGDVLSPRHRADYVICSCESIAVDKDGSYDRAPWSSGKKWPDNAERLEPTINLGPRTPKK